MAAEVGTAVVPVKLDPSGIAPGMQQVEQQTSGRFKKTGQVAGQALQAGFKVGLAGMALVGAGAAKAIQAASGLNEQIDASEVVFGKSAGAMQDWAATGAEAFGLSSREALLAANAYGNMFSTVGLGASDVSSMSQQMVQLAGDMASFHDQDPTDMLDRLRSGLSGEAEPLKQFGVLMTEASVAAAAVSEGIVKAERDTGALKQAQLGAQVAQTKYNEAVAAHGKNSVEAKSALASQMRAQDALKKAVKGTVPELTEAQKVQARYALIMDQTERAQGNFADTSDSLANQQRTLSANTENMAAALGQSLLPAATAVVGVLSVMAGFFQQHTTLAGGLVVAIGSLSAALVVGNLAMKAWNSGLLTVIRSTALWQRSLALLRIAFATTWAAALGPIGLIIIAVAALGIALVVLWKKSETFRRIVTAAWNGIKAAAEFVINWVKDNWMILLGALAGPFGIAIALIIKHFDKIKAAAGAAIQAVKDAFNKVKDIIGSALRSALDAAVDVGQKPGRKSRARDSVCARRHRAENLGPNPGARRTRGRGYRRNRRCGEWSQRPRRTQAALRAGGAAEGGTLAGQPVRGLALRRALSSVQPAETAPPPLDVRVFIGDEELRGMVRYEVREQDARTARVLMAGGGFR